MQRVMAYVDGFNLYFGLKNSDFKRYYWLDVAALAWNELKRCASGYLTIGEDKLRARQLPEQIAKPDGYILTRPTTWR